MAIYNRAQLQPNNKRKLPAQEDTRNQLANQLAQQQLAQQQLAPQQQKAAMGTQADLRQQMLPVVKQANTNPQQQERKPVDVSAIQQQDVITTNQQPPPTLPQSRLATMATADKPVDRSELRQQDNLTVTDQQATDEALRRIMKASPQQPPPTLPQNRLGTMATADKTAVETQAAIPPPPTLPQAPVTTIAAADKPVDRTKLQRQDNLIVTDKQATEEALRRVMQGETQRPDGGLQEREETTLLTTAAPATIGVGSGREDAIGADLSNIDMTLAQQFSPPGERPPGLGETVADSNLPAGIAALADVSDLEADLPPTTATGGGRPPGTLGDLATEEEITSFLTGKRRPDPTTQDLTEAAIRDLLTGAGLDTESEKAARREQAQADEARAIQALRARTGLGGMGLTGAAGALESQIRREATRTRELTEAELDRAAREEALRRTQLGISAGQAEREMAIREQVYGMEMNLYEMETDRDQNGDGFINGVPVGGPIGDGKLENNPDYEGEGPEVREGPSGQYMSEEQASEFVEQQLGMSLDSIPRGGGEGNEADFISPWNTKVATYEMPDGQVIEIFERKQWNGFSYEPKQYFKKFKGID